jgi:hypothetical protein
MNNVHKKKMRRNKIIILKNNMGTHCKLDKKQTKFIEKHIRRM